MVLLYHRLLKYLKQVRNSFKLDKSALQNNGYVIRESMTTKVLAIWPDSARVSVPRFSRLNSVCVT